ncbi:MAG: hypothetical protein JNM57_17190 [Cyclobacteriaceae bacterium]|nr:hypothetical protein [Cyclobacteriaceae bacterium]
MALGTWFKGQLLYVVVTLIGLLLVANIFLIYKNNQVIERNKQLQEEAERVKVNTLDIIRNLHLLDLGIRGYALVKNSKFIIEPIDTVSANKEKIFSDLKAALTDQGYPMEPVTVMKDSVDAYFKFIVYLKQLVDANQEEKFLYLVDQDRGYPIWLKYKTFSKEVNAFEDRISEKAQANYRIALRNSYWLQIVLFLITIPTLAYTAFYTRQTLKIEAALRQSEEDKNKILADQNQQLEAMVNERTREIQTQNEEISAQNEEITAHNEQLVLQQHEIEVQRNELEKQNAQLRTAQQIIEDQSKLIQSKNIELHTEVQRQTQDLKKTNLELIEQNGRLEQFAYIISHNLRAPLARLIGLADILDSAQSPAERDQIIQLMITSTHEFDHVIKDLSFILGIQKMSTKVLGEINFGELVKKIFTMLESEMDETEAELIKDFPEPFMIFSLPQYLESIVYNLISNAIKYRHPNRKPTIKIQAKREGEWTRIDISDNGLGINLKNHHDNLFGLYKRFHFHVEGKGLGLYLVRTQVEALGGRIAVESQVNDGTTFTIFLKNN